MQLQAAALFPCASSPCYCAAQRLPMASTGAIMEFHQAGSKFPLPIAWELWSHLLSVQTLRLKVTMSSSFPTALGDLLPTAGKGRLAGRMVPTTVSAGCVLIYSPEKQKANGIVSLVSLQSPALQHASHFVVKPGMENVHPTSPELALPSPSSADTNASPERWPLTHIHGTGKHPVISGSRMRRTLLCIPCLLTEQDGVHAALLVSLPPTSTKCAAKPLSYTVMLHHEMEIPPMFHPALLQPPPCWYMQHAVKRHCLDAGKLPFALCHSNSC